MDFKDILSIHDAFSFCNSLQFNFFRRTHQSGHHEVLGGAPVVADTLILMHGSQHCNLLKSFSSPTLANNLHEDDIKSYKRDNTTQRMLIDAIQPPDDFRHVVEIPQSCYAVYHGASQGLSKPTGYCHVQKRDGLFRCTNKSCSKKSGLVHFAFASFSIPQMNMADEDVIEQVRSK